MRRAQTLARLAFSTDSLLGKSALVLGASLVIALAAQISVPMFPVPMTLQTLAILLVGFGLGARLGGAALVTYLAQGAMGFPVFASGNGGLPYMFGPTGGFLIGFLAMAIVAGYLADRGVTRRLGGAFAAGLGASALIYLPGLAWPAAIMGASADALWSGWMAPFLVGDAIKALIAALIVTGMASLRARKG